MPVRIFLSILISSVFCQSVSGQDYSSWYQVEVVVFANKTPTQTDEIWPLTALQYPAQMVSVASETAPFSLGQLQDSEAYLALFGENPTDTASTQPTSDFLFESRNRFKVPDVEPNTANGGLGDGEMEGLKPGADSKTPEKIDYDALFVSTAPVPFAALPEERLLLNGLARSIRRSSLYEPLFHAGWLQPVENQNDAMPILIQAGKHYDDMYQLDGTITVSRSRFLHVDTDLWFTEFTPLYQGSDAPLTTAANQLSPELRRQYPEVANWESTRGQNLKVHSHQLRQSRRMRSSTLHFIDHPNFGVLVRIEKFDAPTED